MLQNYLKIATRNLLKNKLFSAINIGGMAISFAIFMIIALFVWDELQFDNHINDVDLKYRVYNDLYSEDGSMRKAAMIPPMIAPTLAAEYPEVEYYARFLNFNGPLLFEAGDKKLSELGGGYADATILDLFSARMIEGDRATAIAQPGTIAISQSLAKKYFGNKPAAGHTIEVGNKPYAVSGVFEDFPAHAHFQINYFLPLTEYEAANPDRMKRWGWNQFHTYIKLKQGADAAQLEGKLKDFAERNAWSTTQAMGTHYIPHLMRIKDIHLYAYDQSWDIAIRGSVQTVYILSASAVFILLIAILNFVNLSTARAVSRVKEVGVRKVMGAFRVQLIRQFVSESVIVALMAIAIAAVISELLIPVVNDFTGKAISSSMLIDPVLMAMLLAFALLTGIAAGSYPAFYISGFKAAAILSKKQGGASGKAFLRQGLVVLQFVLSFFLITGALVVSDQHTFMRNADMGFNKDNLVVISLKGDMRKDMQATKNEFLRNPNVISASMGYGLPGQAYAGDGVIDKVTNKDRATSMLTVDEDYVKTLGLQIVAGRDFSKDFPADEKNAFIVSEAAAKMLGHENPADAIGHELAWNRWDNPDSLKEGTVVGVVKDIHLTSLHGAMTPVILQVYPFAYNTMTLRIKGDDIAGTIAHLETSWKKFNTEWPFEYKFLDENFDKAYKAEEQLSVLFTFFTSFTIVVACLGLFGLVVYSTTQRYKEISIRKVLGATERTLVMMLGRTYVLLIVVAFVIAAPFSYFAANVWLQKFAYRISLTPLVFIESGLFILAIALITVGIQSFNAARSNPVDALKE
ncbi:MAG TPA: ABC transporter permease [Cyclobacteriaceae bacterium]|nr:ABC transporter permease [Cyclobacteriaceae bacterium]